MLTLDPNQHRVCQVRSSEEHLPGAEGPGHTGVGGDPGRPLMHHSQAPPLTVISQESWGSAQIYMTEQTILLHLDNSSREKSAGLCISEVSLPLKLRKIWAINCSLYS